MQLTAAVSGPRAKITCYHVSTSEDLTRLLVNLQTANLHIIVDMLSLQENKDQQDLIPKGHTG